MKLNFQTWLVIGLATAIVGIMAADQFGQRKSLDEGALLTPQTREASLPQATGSVSGATSAILQTAALEQSEFEEAVREEELLNLDSEAIVDFGAAFDSNEF